MNLFKVSNRLYLKLNEGCEQASAKWRASKHPKKLTSERASREDNMKRIKIYVEGGVVQDVIFEGLIKDEEMTYEVIDYDVIDARENKKLTSERASEQKG